VGEQPRDDALKVEHVAAHGLKPELVVTLRAQA
jgi:hypothetical protein